MLVDCTLFCHKIVRCVQEFDFFCYVIVLSLLFADLRVLKMSLYNCSIFTHVLSLILSRFFALFATEVLITVFT
jgi:uncharacterized MnhB-related membrane protein